MIPAPVAQAKNTRNATEGNEGGADNTLISVSVKGI